MLTLEEKKKAHLEFMAAMASYFFANLGSTHASDVAHRVRITADWLLEAYEMRWEQGGKEAAN